MAALFYRDPRSGENGRWQAPRVCPRDRRASTWPRRGPVVAVINAPRLYKHDELEKRRPRGVVPKALCWEAPKGQPVIHGCRRRPHGVRPSGNPKKRREESGPPSSLWTKAAEKERWVVLPNHCLERDEFLRDERSCKVLRKGW